MQVKHWLHWLWASWPLLWWGITAHNCSQPLPVVARKDGKKRVMPPSFSVSANGVVDGAVNGSAQKSLKRTSTDAAAKAETDACNIQRMMGNIFHTYLVISNTYDSRRLDLCTNSAHFTYGKSL